MVAPRGLAKFNRHVTNRILGPLALRLPGFGIIVHTGRKSGRTYRTPVNLFRVDGRCVVALTYGPGSDWVRNVVAAGGCDLVRHGSQVHLAEPRLVHDPRRRLMPAVVRPILAVVGVEDFLELRAASAG
ncbi:MAG TPA: nitroreductase family deazaflavin-dependent oxidoreductase [Pseudonocardiaceae bacterium]